MEAPDRVQRPVPPLHGATDVVRFVRTTLSNASYASRAAIVVIGLDRVHRPVGLAENRRRWSLRSFTSQELAALAAQLDAHALVLVQFVPNKRRSPSVADAYAFRGLARRCAAERTPVLDCIVISADRWWSLAHLAAEAAVSN
jgi:DNA repair protein RadC